MNFKGWLVGQIRRISYRWPARAEAVRNAKVERGKYKCALCEDVIGYREINVDHIVPVVDPADGFKDWNTYVERMFCAVEGFQILCVPCHDKKTEYERQLRKK